MIRLPGQKPLVETQSRRPEDMWRVMRNDPVAARLLKQVYGYKPVVEYPKVTTATRGSQLPPPVGSDASSAAAGGPHVARTQSDKAVPVPKFRGGGAGKVPRQAPIDRAMPHRRREAVMREEYQRIRLREAHYRPPHTRPVGDEEKRRLSEKFSFGGGKALPEELTAPAGPVPSEELCREAEAERVAGVMRRRRGGGSGTPGGEAQPAELMLFDQVCTEIEERQQFVTDMRATGMAYDEPTILAEIDQRMKELDKIGPQKPR